MADRSVVVRLRAEVDRYIAGMRQAKAATTDLGKELTGQGKISKQQLDMIGNGATVMAGAITLAFGASIKAAADWESAFAGVLKTVDGSPEQLARLEQGLRNMAKELPASHAEIAAVAEAAGQLGVKVEDVERFTRVMIDLGETTNLSADEAATALARFMNIMGTSQRDVDRLGSTIVALGNNAATTEAEIVEMALRIAGAGKQIGLTEAQVFAFASTLSSLGIPAEAGGSAISRVMIQIASEVETSGSKLDDFARVAGMSVDEFSRLFREDAAGAVLAFVTGLGNAEAQGSSTIQMLEEMGLTEQRVRDALLRMAGGGELLAEQLGLATDAFGANNALAEEAAKRYETTAAQMEMLRNQVVDLGIDIGGVLLPAVNAFVDVLGAMFTGLSNMPDLAKTGIMALGGLNLAFAAGVITLTKVVPKIRDLRAALLSLGTAGRVASMAVPWLAALTAAAATLTYVMGRNAEAQRAAEERALGYAEAIKNAGDVTLGVTEQIAELVRQSEGFAALLTDLGINAVDLGTALAGSDEQWETFRAQLIAGAEAAGVTGLALEALKNGLDQQRDAAVRGAEHAKNAAEATEGVGEAAEGAAPAVNALGEELGINAEQAKAAKEEFDAYITALRASVDPVFGFLDAIEKNRKAQADYAEAVASGTKTQAELDAMLRDVARSALDLEGASMELYAAMARGEVSAEEFTSRLGDLVQQGAITEQQAAALTTQFNQANGELDRFDGTYVANLYANDQASGTINWLLSQLNRLGQGVTVGIRTVATGVQSWANWGGGSTGGLVPSGLTPLYRAEGGLIPPPVGTDTVPAMLTPGEFVVQKSAVDRFGVGFMEALNEGRISSVGGAVTVAVHNEISVGGSHLTPRQIADAAEQGTRRGVARAGL